MRLFILLLVSIIFVSCSPDAEETTGVVYEGKANLNKKLHEFTAVNKDTEKSITLTMTGPRELTFNLNDNISRIDYETDVIIVRSETDASEWTAKKVKDGFELEDGTTLELGDCQDWNMCIFDGETKEPILKGKYSLSGSRVSITLWISESERHAELLGLMTNALFNKSRNAHQSIQSALETLSVQVWTY